MSSCIKKMVNSQINSVEELSRILKNKNNSFMHVFLINNPLNLIISRLIIDALEIDEKSIFIATTRKTNTSIINCINYFPDDYWFDKYFIKIFGISLKGFRIRNMILKKRKKFILYTPWAHLEAQKIIDSRLCYGHIYIEEGQMAYRKIKPYKYKKPLFFLDLIRNIWLFLSGKRVLTAEKRLDLFRHDAITYVGLTNEMFPLVPKEEKIILQNFSNLKNYYQPKLLGVKTIGLTCAERRIKSYELKTMLETLIQKMPNGGVIKIHPSFYHSNLNIDNIKSILKTINPRNIELCDEDVILEIEMLYEFKYLIGPLTSLQTIANHFGSKFEHIDLYSE